MTEAASLSPLLERKTIPARLLYMKENHGDCESFVFFTPRSRVAITYGRLYDLAARFACRLRDQGFKRHDVIANTLPNCPERVVTDLGIVFAGCTPLNGQIVQTSGDDFFQSARTANCRGVVVCVSDRHQAWRLLKDDVRGNRTGLFAQVSCAQARGLTTAILVSRGDSALGCSLMNDLTSGESYVADVTPDDIIQVFTTSGMGGYSKLVARPNKYLFAMKGPNDTGMTKYNVEHNISTFNDRPLGWVGGFPSATYVNGLKRLLLDRFDDLENRSEKTKLIWQILQMENTRFPYVTSQDAYDILLHVSDLKANDRIPTIGTAGQPITKSFVKDLFKIAKCVLVCYASTEAGLIAIKTISENDQQEDFCVGKPVVEKIRIVNKVLQDCQPGEVGTVWVKDSNVCSGYFDPLKSGNSRPGHAFLKDDWFNTEDNGYIDAKGELHVLGRQGDVITHGVHQIYPGWLEKKVSSHADVSDVVMAPVSDPVLHHEICACVKPMTGHTLTEAGLKQIVQGMLVTDGDASMTPMPKYFLILDDLPTLGTGKIDRKSIKNIAEKKFGKSGK